jgi:hypothetical protein
VQAGNRGINFTHCASTSARWPRAGATREHAAAPLRLVRISLGNPMKASEPDLSVFDCQIWSQIIRRMAKHTRTANIRIKPHPCQVGTR